MIAEMGTSHRETVFTRNGRDSGQFGVQPTNPPDKGSYAFRPEAP